MEDKLQFDKPNLVELGGAKSETRDGFPLKERFDFVEWAPYCW